jgi:hypothetical protein
VCKNVCILYRGNEYKDLEKCLFLDLIDSIVEKMVMTRTATEERVGLKRCFVTFLSFLIRSACLQRKRVKIVVNAQGEA